MSAAKKQRCSPRLASRAATAEASEVTPECGNQQLEIVAKNLTQYDGKTAAAISEAKAEADAHVSSEMGVVEEIYCENSMCHRKLRVALSPNINFITGENGSGKSAIIAAIQICLGANARTTHRGKNLKTLIRHGFDGNALVRVTLRNDAVGSDAFHPELFGRKIQVERLIRRDGSAEYRLKDEHGLQVSKVKTDLVALLDHLNIPTENPCAILVQENAKLFLKGSPTDKYKFFLQSTELDKMRTTFANIEEELRKIAESTLQHEQSKIAALEDAMKKAKEHWQEAQSIEKLVSYLGVVKAELEWSFVREKEEQVTKVEAKLVKTKCDADQAAARCAWARAEVEKLEKRQSELNSRLEETSKRMDQCNNRKTDIKKEVREIRGPLHQKQSQLTQLAQSKKREAQRLAGLQRVLKRKKEEHEELLCKVGSSDLRDRLEQKRQETAQTQQSICEAELRIQHTPDDAEKLEDRHSNCLRYIDEVEGGIRNDQYRLRSLQNRKTNSLAVFGSNISCLEQLIEANLSRFTAPPIGPFGKFVKLPKEFMRFAMAIEITLKGTLKSYLVVNSQDKKLLDDLRRQARCQNREAEIIISQLTNDEVFNTLIDMCSTESKLLFDDRQTAEKSVLQGRSGGFRMARAYIANKRYIRRPIICEDVEGEIRGLEQRLDALHRDLQDVCSQESQLRADREKLYRAATQENDHINNLSRRYNRQYSELQNLESESSDLQQDHTLDTTVLDHEISKVQKDLTSLEAREVELQKCITVSKHQLEGPLAELGKLNAEENEVAAELNDPQRDANELYKQLSKMKSDEIMTRRQDETSKASVERMTKQLALLQQDQEGQEEKASQVCTRPANILPRHAYDKRMKQAENRLASFRRRLNGLSLAELKDDMELKEIKYNAKKTNYDTFRQNLLQIWSMLKERKTTWNRFRTALSRRTSNEFSKYMMKNNFVGKLKFRHEEQQVEIAVLQNEQGATSASQMTDMKELSGGERSYTQVALLLALGKSTECPFRIMDEFDVFMDSVNRDMTMKLLVDADKKEGKKQFVFVTPNNLSTLPQDPMVKIQTMYPPRDRNSNVNTQ
ncbi:ABC transporter SMC family [Phytophthora cinnamomi]|uniref:ABC transporter SMC family n=1 Tax=Phytophthora cinnamomi TaxID=4785 RepID=UPI00355A8B6D|nr:ABC transporter SMC family [Phytophthora cinnamomi]